MALNQSINQLAKSSIDFEFVALRGVATLKARALKEVWNVAAAVPIERGPSLNNSSNNNNNGNNTNSSSNNSGSYCEELVPEENFLAACSRHRTPQTNS